MLQMRWKLREAPEDHLSSFEKLVLPSADLIAAMRARRQA